MVYGGHRMSLRTPLSKVRGLGSAKDGTHHFWYQRITAIVLVPLILWICYSLIRMTTMEYESVLIWISSPINTLLLLALVIAVFFHALLGIQVVIEDYIHTEWQKIASIILVKFLVFLAGMASVLAIVKIFLGL
jgi:succinate dehydrogenase / fumarate reductase membrane anchor subunit